MTSTEPSVSKPKTAEAATSAASRQFSEGACAPRGTAKSTALLEPAAGGSPNPELRGGMPGRRETQVPANVCRELCVGR